MLHSREHVLMRIVNSFLVRNVNNFGDFITKSSRLGLGVPSKYLGSKKIISSFKNIINYF